jgi:hypothetical protein
MQMFPLRGQSYLRLAQFGFTPIERLLASIRRLPLGRQIPTFLHQPCALRFDRGAVMGRCI